MRGQIGLRLDDAVQEPGLVEKVDWFGFVERGDAHDGYTRGGQGGNGNAQVGGAVANVRSERQVDGRHAFILILEGATSRLSLDFLDFCP